MELCCSHLRSLFVAREPAVLQIVDRQISDHGILGNAGFVNGQCRFSTWPVYASL